MINNHSIIFINIINDFPFPFLTLYQTYIDNNRIYLKRKKNIYLEN